MSDPKRVEWCVEHKSATANVTRGFPSCEWVELNPEVACMPCRIVSKLLVDPTTEEER